MTGDAKSNTERWSSTDKARKCHTAVWYSLLPLRETNAWPNMPNISKSTSAVKKRKSQTSTFSSVKCNAQMKKKQYCPYSNTTRWQLYSTRSYQRSQTSAENQVACDLAIAAELIMHLGYSRISKNFIRVIVKKFPTLNSATFSTPE